MTEEATKIECPVCFVEADTTQPWCTLPCACRRKEGEAVICGRDICKPCVRFLLQINLELKCPICRSVVKEVTSKQTTSVVQHLQNLTRKRKRNNSNEQGSEDEDECEISHIIGIEALSPNEISYLVMWKKTDGPGAFETVWQDQSFVQGVKVDEFHKRFSIPPVTSAMFKFPTYFEHQNIKSARQGRRGPIFYKCSCCDYQSSRCNNVITHMGVNHFQGNAKELYLKCVTCEKQCSTPGNLLQHVKKCFNFES